MESIKEKNKSVKKSNTEKQVQSPSAHEPEQKGYSWELIFIIAAFGTGTILLILKIAGVV